VGQVEATLIIAPIQPHQACVGHSDSFMAVAHGARSRSPRATVPLTEQFTHARECSAVQGLNVEQHDLLMSALTAASEQDCCVWAGLLLLSRIVASEQGLL